MSANPHNTSALASANGLIEGLLKLGLQAAVVSPGSRNAPLMQALHTAGVYCVVALDERAAAHHALGMALALGQPVAVCCTSGTAALNHGPALAEADRVNLPLISLTADRPEGAADQWESQTLMQTGVHALHVRADFLWSPETSEQSEQTLHAIGQALLSGPVHVNCPFSEPLYSSEPAQAPVHSPKKFGFSTPPVEQAAPLALDNLTTRLEAAHSAGSRILLLGGTQPHELRKESIEAWSKIAVVAGDSTGGIGCAPKAIVATDRWMKGWKQSKRDWNDAHPDLVVTFGAPLLSKALRQQLRTAPVQHIHIDPSGRAPEAFGPSVVGIEAPVAQALDTVAERIRTQNLSASQEARPWLSAWTDEEEQRRLAHPAALKAAPWSDLRAHAALHEAQPSEWTLHLGNSTPVRYAQLFHQTDANPPWSNRGVAGIDGCSSTAVGAALTGQKVTLITGDLGFLYDGNAFIVDPLPADLRMAVIHNGGGGVFRWLDGPQRTGLLNSHFEMRHGLQLRALCDLHGLEHQRVNDEQGLKAALKGWWTPSDSPRLLEICTPSEESADVYKAYMAAVSD